MVTSDNNWIPKGDRWLFIRLRTFPAYQKSVSDSDGNQLVN